MGDREPLSTYCTRLESSKDGSRGQGRLLRFITLILVVRVISSDGGVVELDNNTSRRVLQRLTEGDVGNADVDWGFDNLKLSGCQFQAPNRVRSLIVVHKPFINHEGGDAPDSEYSSHFLNFELWWKKFGNEAFPFPDNMLSSNSDLPRSSLDKIKAPQASIHQQGHYGEYSSSSLLAVYKETNFG